MGTAVIQGSGDQESSSEIRVGYVIDSLRRDGTQTALIYLVNGLAERGYQQRVYSLNDVVNPHVRKRLTGSAAQVTVIGKRKLVTFQGIATLVREWRRWQPEIVQTFLPFGNLIGPTVARAAGVPAIVSSIRARNIEKRRWQFLLDRITLRWVDRVVFNSQLAIPFAIEHEGVRADQIVYIPNCVQVEPLGQPAGRAEIRSRLDVPLDGIVVGTVGRLYWQKGHSYLLSAFQRVLHALPNAWLILIGDGPLRRDLEVEARRLGVAEQTRFLGERSDVPQLLAALDLYVQASIYEGMPNAIMEAMVVGKPVVATNVDGIRELITHGETGWLVDACNPQALAGQILHALENTDEGARLGAAAAQRMHSDFSVDKMVTAYDELYRGLRGNRGS
jgi:glycosyltransferase involved in cell wall biosynthesis